MIIDKKCTCGNKSTGNTTIRCCNLCGLPLPNEPWHFNLDENIFSRVGKPVKPANGGQIYLLYKRLLGYSDMTPILVAVFDDVEKALDKKYQLQKDDHANSYFIEDSRLSV